MQKQISENKMLHCDMVLPIKLDSAMLKICSLLDLFAMNFMLSTRHNITIDENWTKSLCIFDMRVLSSTGRWIRFFEED